MINSADNGLRIFGSPYFSRPKKMSSGVDNSSKSSTGFLAQWASRHYPLNQRGPSLSMTTTVAHPSNTKQEVQDKLLMRTKAEWEKEQAAAAAAMCYWGYGDQNHFMFGAGRGDWKSPDKNQPLHTYGPSTVPKPNHGPIKKRHHHPPRAPPPSLLYPQDDPAESSKPFPCEDCGKSFRQLSQLATHQRIHTGDRPFLCSECPKAFRTQGTLAIHRRIHTGEKPYSCEECGRSFRTQGTLVIHRRTHTGDRPYKCQDCGKAFAARCSLVVHWRTHTGEKPYMCTECGKLFASRSDSARHTRTHQAAAPGKKNLIKRVIQSHPAL